MRFKHFGELRVSQRNFFFLIPSLTEVTGLLLPLPYSAHFFSFTQVLETAGSSSDSDPTTSGNSDNACSHVHKLSLIQLILNPFDLERALPDEAVRRNQICLSISQCAA